MATEEPSLTRHGRTTTIRISRGATVMGTDGALGTVHQIIMDQRTGELQALVVATDDMHQLELPAIHVLRASESTVSVDVSRADLRQHPELATPYNPDQYVPVRENPFLPPSEASRGATFSERPVVTNVEHDAVGVVVPEPSTQTAEMIASMTTPETERYIPQPQPVPPTSADAPAPSTTTGESDASFTEIRAGGPLPPSSLTPTAPLLDRAEEERLSARAKDAPPTPADSHDEATAAIPDTAPKAVINAIDEMNANASEPVITPPADASEVPAPANDAPELMSEATPSGIASSGATEPYMADADTDQSDAISGERSASGLENATNPAGAGMDVPAPEVEEDAFMEGSVPPVNPVNPGVASDAIHDDEDTISTVFGESQHSYTTPPPPELSQRGWGRQRLTSSSNEDSGNQLSWAPAVALGVVIVGIAAWSMFRAIRRGRRKAAEAAQNARISAESLRATVRDSVRDAGKSAVELAQTMRASAQEVAASPRGAATDTLSNLSDIQARYRWFRRGIRVGARTSRLRRK